MKTHEAEFVASLYKGNNILGISLLSISVTAVLLAMFIFSSFVSLQNVRTLLLKHLLVAFLFEDFLTLIQQALVYLARKMKVPDIRCFFKSTVFCETLLVLSKYTSLASLTWVLVLVVYQWRSTKPWYNGNCARALICAVGWLFSCVPTITWTVILALTHKGKCWNGHLSMSSIWIIEGPKFGLLFLILLFLMLTMWKLFDRKREIINIDEILRKRAQLRQCMCVFVWICVGQVTYIVSAHAPMQLDIRSLAAWSYVVTMLMSSKGFVVSICFCFLESDVREALKTPITT
ncbi:PDF receptor-like [Haliotis cracherodii]|uniref:PDF receptor-like n=1 Tax=Haliotis cracherodii TaxID=6455 RepID=UPI0039EBD294